MFFFDALFTLKGFTYFVILSFLEIILGIDNIIFVSIVTHKLPKEKQRAGRNIGLSLALIMRLILIFFVSWLMKSTVPLFPDTTIEILKNFSIQSLVLLLGGLFLIYKSTIEMHSSIKGLNEKVETPKKHSLSSIIIQIILIDIVFSFDSIITAIGMTNDLQKQIGHSPLVIIYAAVIISMIVMIIFTKSISNFINSRPTIKMIALAFLVTIGVILVAEAFGQHVPKGYIYFAMIYALIVEFLNIKMRKNKGILE
jgi:predicted tellurium resistance membrane protein TerC